MMIGVTVTSNAAAIIAEIDGLTSGEQRKAVMRALNRAGDGVKTDANREIRKTYKVKVSTLNKAFGMQRATSATLRMVVMVNGRPLSLAGFDARQTMKGISVDVKSNRKIVAHSFLRNITSKYGAESKVAFMRVGSARYPLKALKSVAVPGLFTIADVQKVLDEGAFDRFEKELHHQLAYLLKLKD